MSVLMHRRVRALFPGLDPVLQYERGDLVDIVHPSHGYILTGEIHGIDVIDGVRCYLVWPDSFSTDTPWTYPASMVYSAMPERMVNSHRWIEAVYMGGC